MEQSRLKQQALAVLKRFYGYDHFYPLQWQVISHVMQGRDAVVLMPTGGGNRFVTRFRRCSARGVP